MSHDAYLSNSIVHFTLSIFFRHSFFTPCLTFGVDGRIYLVLVDYSIKLFDDLFPAEVRLTTGRRMDGLQFFSFIQIFSGTMIFQPHGLSRDPINTGAT